MARPNALDAQLQALALKVVKDALDGVADDGHKTRVETLKVAGNFAVATKRGKKSELDADDDNTMSAVQRRINNAGAAVQ